MIAGLLVGVLFVVGGLLLRPRPRPDELRTRGAVVESRSGFIGGEPTFVYVVEFHDAAGRAWRFRPPMGKARRPAVGSEVAVAYSPSDPQATARRTDGLDGCIHWVVAGVGAAVAIGFLVALLV